MNFVFDESSDKQLKAAMLMVFDRIKDWLREEKELLYANMGELSFGDSVKAAPLQASDLLAYQAHQYAKSAAGDEHYPVNDVYRRAMIRFKTRDDFWLYDTVRLAQIGKVAELSSINGHLKELPQ
jgi:hypothetical protein